MPQYLQVAELGAELTNHKQTAFGLKREVHRLEGICLATGEQAAAAETKHAAATETIMQLQEQLAEWRERWVCSREERNIWALEGCKAVGH